MTADTERSDPQLGRPIRVSSPADLVGTIPYLVGFTPRRSLVTLSLRGPRLRCGLLARVDLPDLDADVAPLADDIVARLLSDGPDEVAVLVYDDVPWSPCERPWHDLVDAIELELAVAGVAVREACYVTSERFWSYACWEPQCCPDEGTAMTQARSGPAAAAMVALGRAPLADRDDLRDQVAAGDPTVTDRVGRLARKRRRELVDADLEAAGRRVATVFAELVGRRTQPQSEPMCEPPSDPTPLTAEEAALLVAGLSDTVIRDEIAVRWVTWLSNRATEHAPRDAFGLPGRSPTHDAVTSLLQDLARMSDGAWAVSPLTLYALQCWHAGNGALANLAIDRALQLDPGYRMALLVDGVLRAGIRPQR